MKKVIEINESNSKAFCREVTSVVSNYKGLLRKPERKINDVIRSYRWLIVMDFIMLILFGGNFFNGERNVLLLMIFSFSLISLVLLLLTYPKIKQFYKSVLSDNEPSIFTMDENGIELTRGLSKSVRLGWNSVALVRAFRNSVCFLDADATGFIIAVSIKYKDEIANYLSENQITITRVDL